MSERSAGTPEVQLQATLRSPFSPVTPRKEPGSKDSGSQHGVHSTSPCEVLAQLTASSPPVPPEPD